MMMTGTRLAFAICGINISYALMKTRLPDPAFAAYVKPFMASLPIRVYADGCFLLSLRTWAFRSAVHWQLLPAVDRRFGSAATPDNIVNLTVTSPPYDKLRTYSGKSVWHTEFFDALAPE
jgi:hypothetical protein